MEQRKLQVWLPLFIGLALALGILAGFQLAGSSGRTSSSNKNRSAIQQVLDLVQYKYVDSVSLDSMEADGIQAMLNHLDPHTVFIPAQELAEANADLEGGFSGIGVEYQMINDTMNVVYVVENGPSAKAGLKTGDRIIKVYDKVIAGNKLKGSELRKLLRGDYNTKVEVTALRDGKTQTYTITRGNVPLPSVEAAYMAEPGVGYIKLNKFSETTYKEFMDAATGLQAKGMKKMILDLRGNTGGILTEATNIADELLPDGLSIVSTRGSHVKNKEIQSTKPGIFEKEPLVVLIDEFSASASEVLAGALQDNDRGIIIGRRSFGKGLVQEQYDLTNGGAVRITVARYYTPSGRSIQKPYNGSRNDYQHEVLERNPAKEDSSLQKSKEVYTTRAGKKVYGGGGITPDITVAFDSSRVPQGSLPLFSGNRIGDFSFRLFQQMKGSLTQYKTPSDFIKQYQLPANTWDMYTVQLQQDSVKISEVSVSVKNDILLIIKANMARYQWRNNAFYETLQPTDKLLQQALQTLKSISK